MSESCFIGREPVVCGSRGRPLRWAEPLGLVYALVEFLRRGRLTSRLAGLGRILKELCEPLVRRVDLRHLVLVATAVRVQLDGG